MNRTRRLWRIAALLAVLLPVALPPSTSPPIVGADASGQSFPLMHPDEETFQEWMRAYDTAPRTEVSSQTRAAASPGGSVDLLPHLDYIPSERSQGSCGNCWVWAGTGCLEIALSTQEDIRDRLSVQVVNSCRSVIGKSCCQGGWLNELASFYSITGRCLPWDNENADWQDRDGGCSVPCGDIATEPYYDIAGIEMLTIPTRTPEVSTREQAIANIKAVLDSGEGVWFAFFAPSTGWQQFDSFWSSADESAVIDMDSVCSGSTSAGGHAVLCVGYNDTDPNHRYWTMLNSWGTAAGKRPNGLFRINMDMDYNTTCGIASFYWQTLDVRFRFPPVVATGEVSSVAAQTATVHGTLEHDSGTPTDVRFEYGTSAGGFYTNATEWQQGFTAPADFQAEISGLLPGTHYYYRAQAQNSGGTSTGEERTFLTRPAAPGRFSAQAVGEDRVELSWQRGDGASTTTIWRTKDLPPTGPGDGVLVYEGTGTTFTDTGLEAGTKYYYLGQSTLGDAPLGPLWGDDYSQDCAHTIGNGTWMAGDADLDGRVTMADVLSILQYRIAGTLDDNQLRCADTNDDGRVTMADALHIMQFRADPYGMQEILLKPLWETPADDGLLDPLRPCGT